jgi:hypothetical protein
MLKRKIILIAVSILISIFGFIIYTNINSRELTRIEKVIKFHNGIKDLNQKYPTVSKPPSSQTTVIGGDSVRVITK